MRPGGGGPGRTAGQWDIAGAAVAGERHQRDGAECEDKIAGRAVGKRRRRVVALALADGAGSAAKAAIGAQAAAEAACAELLETFDVLAASDTATIAARVIGRVRESLERAAAGRDAPLGDFACTLAFVAVGRGRFIAGSIGDSVVATVRESAGEVLLAAENGQFVNQTYFATQPDATARTRVITGPAADRDCFMLMSDGAAERLIDEATSAPTAGALKIGRWLLRYPRDVVEDRLQAALAEHFIPHGDDDCAIALLAFVPRRRPPIV